MAVVDITIVFIIIQLGQLFGRLTVRDPSRSLIRHNEKKREKKERGRYKERKIVRTKVRTTRFFLQCQSQR